MTNPYNNNLLLQLDALIGALELTAYKQEYIFKKIPIRDDDGGIFKIFVKDNGYKIVVKLTIDVISDTITDYLLHDYLYNLVIDLRRTISVYTGPQNIIISLLIMFKKIDGPYSSAPIIPINITLFDLILNQVFSIVNYDNIGVVFTSIHPETERLVYTIFNQISNITDYDIHRLEIILYNDMIDKSILDRITNHKKVGTLEITCNVLNLKIGYIRNVRNIMAIYTFDKTIIKTYSLRKPNEYDSFVMRRSLN